jgi:hypothetical protein
MRQQRPLDVKLWLRKSPPSCAQSTIVPADLDLKPYRDEHDDDLVQRMLASIRRGQEPGGVTANHIEQGDRPLHGRRSPLILSPARPSTKQHPSA